jgi:hydroxymethylpyrimidine pyrophosphatase-like HAD family hydrolase
VVSSRIAYKLHRVFLSAVASLTGAVHSMPAAGERLTDAAIKSAASKRVVISDFDDTLAAYNQTLSPEMIAAIAAVRAAGKHFVVISDRGDEKRAHQLTVFESLETMPVALRAGMYVAANAGGRVYRYDEQGVPQRVFEVPALEAERRALVERASAATKERMKALGAEQHDPVTSGNNNPAESWNTYGYAMMLKVGSSEAQVRGAAAIMQEELAKVGIEAEVNPRFAKDPANPPYINFSIVTKQPATAYIAKALGATAKDVVLVGDSQYQPREAKNKGGFLDRMGAKLAGRAMPQTGNQTDRNMEKALPGALVFAVGHNADPRMSNAWVTAVKGPESTRRMLLSVASQPAKSAAPAKAGEESALMTALGVLGIVALLAAAGVAGYMFLSAIAEILVQGEQMLRDGFGHDEFFMLGAGGLMLGSLRNAGKKDGEPSKKTDEDKPISRAERVVTGVLLALALGGSLYLWYLLYAGFGQLAPAPIEVPPGWQGPIPDINDIFGFAGLGMAGTLAAGSSSVRSGLRAGLSKVKEFLRPAFPFLAWLGLASLTAAIYAGFYWAASNAPAATPAVPVAPFGWESLFQAGGLGAAALGLGMMTRPAVLDNPGDSYAKALETATKLAAERGVAADKVLFVQATAVMPLHQGKQWHYQFALPRQNGRHDLVYVDLERNLTAVGLDQRVSVYENVSVLPEGAVAKSLTPYLLAQRGALHGPQQALDALRAQQPGFGASVSVALRLEQTEDLDPWYRFYDNNGAQAAVNARTKEIRVAVAPAPELKKAGLSGTAKFLIAAALAAVAYALVTGQLGAAAGFVFAAGAVAKSGKGKAKLSDDEVRAAASAVISYKGRPWSSTEFNSVYYPALENLKARGATKKQVALFEKLVADAPIKGGSFNPWSGD